MTHLSIPGFWRLNKAKYRLIGAKCDGCGQTTFPPRMVCSACGDVKFKEVKLNDFGQILSWSMIHVAPDGFESPYAIGLVKLSDDVVVPTQIVGDVSKLEIGAPVRVVFRKLGKNNDGLLLYGFKFALI